jgi:dolichyl-phosphate beta-glucosyltransferase
MSNAGAPTISLVIPAYNEAARLPQSLRKLTEFSQRFTVPVEVLVVIEKSTDGTVELAREAVAKQTNFRIISNDVQRGKGYAVRTGMLRAAGEFLFYMDADLSIPLDEVLFFMDYFTTHPSVDIIIGNREHAQSRVLSQQSPLRQKMGRVFNNIIQSLALLEIHDTQCGFKAFRKKAAHELFSRQQLDGFAFDVELLLLAERLGFEIVDLPVRLTNSPGSKVHIIRDSLHMLSDVIRVRKLVEKSLKDNPPERSNGASQPSLR